MILLSTPELLLDCLQLYEPMLECKHRKIRAPNAFLNIECLLHRQWQMIVDVELYKYEIV